MADPLDDKDGFEPSIQELLDQLMERNRNRTMTLEEAVSRACKEPTLVQALSFIAVWETDRAVKQAVSNTEKGERTAEGGLYETCFGVSFQALLAKYSKKEQNEQTRAVF